MLHQLKQDILNMTLYNLFRLFLICCSFAILPTCAIEHTENGTNYGDSGIDIYTQMRHGPDGSLFLDPYFMPYLLNLEGKVLLDAGCGAGPWSIVAAKNGACVYGIDIQDGMIEKAKKAALEANVESVTNFVVGDVGDLPYPNDFFDRAISINVGCNLPALEPHIKELKRVLKKGGLAVITAPISFGTIFTNGNRTNQEIIDTINQLLLGNQDTFPRSIQDLDEVYRATFAIQQGICTLIMDEALLNSGDKIWRKIPMMVVPNHYHSEDEYLTLFIKEGFRVEKIYRPKFPSNDERECYNKDQELTLSTEYVSSAPFVIFIIENQ